MSFLKICLKISLGPLYLSTTLPMHNRVLQEEQASVSIIDQTDQYMIFHHTYGIKSTDLIIVYLSESQLAKEFHELEVARCICNRCWREEKKDRFHTIPPILQKLLPHACHVTRKKIKKNGLYKDLVPEIGLHSGFFALVLEARIINAKKINLAKDSLQDFIQQPNQRKRGHYCGAYVFIYNDSKHCVHAMFHKKTAA